MLRRSLVALALLSSLAAVAIASGCKRSKPKAKPPSIASIEGVAALPAGLDVVVGVEVGKLASSPLVARALAQMFLRDPELERRIDGVLRSCKLDPAVDVRSALIATRAGTGDAVGGIETLLVMSGRFDEAELSACLGQYMSAEGGTLSSRVLEGRTVYQAVGSRTVWFSFGSPTTVVVSASEALLGSALGATPRLAADTEMAALLGLADRDAALWGAGRVNAQVGQGLLRASGGQLASPPQAILGAFDPGDGVRLSLGILMESTEQANILKELVESQVGALALFFQGRGLGPLAAKLEVKLAGARVELSAALSQQEVSELLSRIDIKGTSDEDTGPAKQE